MSAPDTDFGAVMSALQTAEGAYTHATDGALHATVFGLQRRLPGDTGRWRTIIPFREPQAGHVRLLARLLAGLYPPIALRVAQLSPPYHVVGVWDGRAWVRATPEERERT